MDGRNPPTACIIEETTKLFNQHSAQTSNAVPMSSKGSSPCNSATDEIISDTETLISSVYTDILDTLAPRLYD